MLTHAARIVVGFGVSLLALTATAGTVVAGSPVGAEGGAAARSDGVAPPWVWPGTPTARWSGGPPSMPGPDWQSDWQSDWRPAWPPAYPASSLLPPFDPPFYPNLPTVAGAAVTPATVGPTDGRQQPTVVRSGILSQHRTDDAYLLDIDTARVRPEQVQVGVAGRVLVVRVGHHAERRRETTTGDGRSVARAYRWSSGSSMRRLPVPPDGDLASMTREDGPDGVRIVIPRRAAPVQPPGPAPTNGAPAPTRQRAPTP